MMSDQAQPVYLTPEGRPWGYIRVEGEEVTRHEAGREEVQGIRLQYGEFGFIVWIKWQSHVMPTQGFLLHPAICQGRLAN